MHGLELNNYKCKLKIVCSCNAGFFCGGLLSYARGLPKNTSGFSQVMGVSSVFVGFHGHSDLQSFKCVCVCGVWSVDTRVHTQSSFSIFTLGTAVLYSLHSGVVILS